MFQLFGVAPIVIHSIEAQFSVAFFPAYGAGARIGHVREIEAFELCFIVRLEDDVCNAPVNKTNRRSR